MLIERADFKTRFKKGQSGNPKGRPKGRRNDRNLLGDVLFKTITVRENNRRRTIPKIVAAMEVCLNSALKGDLKAFSKIIDFAERWDLLQGQTEHKEVRELIVTRRIVDPKEPEKVYPHDEYMAKLKGGPAPS
jgi:hypothetical protein